MFNRIISSFAGQLFTALIGLAIVSACSMETKTQPAFTHQLANTHWEVKTLSGYQAAMKRAPTLSFTQDRLSGFNGCNRFFTHYTAGQNGTMTIGQLGATKMACLDQTGELERNLNAALLNTKLFALSRDALNLMDGERNVLLILTPKAAE